MRTPIASFSFSLFLIGILSISLACGSQNPLVEKQKGEIDYLTRENEELHRLIAQMEAEGQELDSDRAVARSTTEETSVEETQTDSEVVNPPSRVLQAETMSDEKRIESTDDIAKPEIEIKEDVAIKGTVPDPIIESAIEKDPELVQEPETLSPAPVETEIVEEVQNIDHEEEGDIVVESSQAPSYIDQPELYADDEVVEEGISEEEAERIAWENRPRQRPQAPLASLSTRQFFEDGTANLTRSAKIYLKLVATILNREHGEKVIEIESQDVDDEPELLSDRLNTVLQELERKIPGILERVVLLETPLTYSDSKKVEDPHHIKFYPVKLGDQ